MQLICGGQTARKFAVPTHGIGINAITNAAFGRVVVGSFVHAAFNASVAVAINQAGRHMFVGGVNHNCVSGNVGKVRTHGFHFSIDHKQVGIFQSACGTTGPNSGVFHKYSLSDWRFFKSIFTKRRDRGDECQWVLCLLFWARSHRG